MPPGVTLDTATGLISGTPTTAGTYNSEIKVEDATDSTFQITEALTFSVTGSGSETVEFDTPAGPLGTFDANDDINETVSATASQGSAITYTFTATNSENAFGLTGTGISVTGNNISGIAPRFYVAATFTFDFTAEIGNGATNSRTFEIDILEDSTCISPTDNICT